jgi:hypothetical protein
LFPAEPAGKTLRIGLTAEKEYRPSGHRPRRHPERLVEYQFSVARRLRNMNLSLRLIALAAAGICLFAVNAPGQVGADGGLMPMISPTIFRSEAPPDVPGPVFRNRYDGDWLTATADILVMDRIGPRSVPLVFDVNSGAELLNTNDLDFKWEFGPKVSIIAHDVLFGLDFEGVYFGIDGYHASETVYSTPNNPVEFRLPAWSRRATSGDGLQFDYYSRIYNAELNARYCFGDRLTFLAGFRWIDLHEDFTGASVYTGGITSQFLDINVANHLYGGQIGLDVSLLPCKGPFRIDGVLKAGVFGNYSDQTVLVGSQIYGDKRDHTAFVGELNLLAVYEITPQLLLRGGYQVMWLEGVALAGDQPATFGVSGNYQPDTDGSLFYHGAFAGLEFNY